MGDVTLKPGMLAYLSVHGGSVHLPGAEDWRPATATPDADLFRLRSQMRRALHRIDDELDVRASTAPARGLTAELAAAKENLTILERIRDRQYAELTQLRERLATAERERHEAREQVDDVLWGKLVAERDRLLVEREERRPVVEAARAYAKAHSDLGKYRPEADPALDRLGDLADAQRTSRESLIAAVDALHSTRAHLLVEHDTHKEGQ